MQNPEKGCPNFAKSEASREVPTLRQYITELMLCGQEQQLRFVVSIPCEVVTNKEFYPLLICLELSNS